MTEYTIETTDKGVYVRLENGIAPRFLEDNYIKGRSNQGSWGRWVQRLKEDHDIDIPYDLRPAFLDSWPKDPYEIGYSSSSGENPFPQKSYWNQLWLEGYTDSRAGKPRRYLSQESLLSPPEVCLEATLELQRRLVRELPQVNIRQIGDVVQVSQYPLLVTVGFDSREEAVLHVDSLRAARRPQDA